MVYEASEFTEQIVYKSSGGQRKRSLGVRT